MTRFLYGDSSPSPIDINYIDFLRRSLDFWIAVLRTETRVAAGRDRRAELEERTAAHIAEMDRLADAVRTLLAPLSGQREDSPAVRCASSIEAAAESSVRGEAERLRESLADAAARIEAAAREQRQGYVDILAELLRTYDLPDARTELHVALDFGADYSAQLRARTPYGAAAVIELAIPDDSPFTRDLRVNRFAGNLKIRVPEHAGWIRKQLKLVPHGVGKFIITAVTVTDDATTVELRSTAELTGAGYDVVWRGRDAIELTQIGREGEATDPFDASLEDLDALSDLAEKLAEEASALRDNRTALLAVTLDDVPLVSHEYPAVLVERMVEAMTPVVSEIAAHSATDTELVLRRQLTDDRREEIFVSKQELADKLAVLAEPERQVFAALGLGTPRDETVEIDAGMVVDDAELGGFERAGASVEIRLDSEPGFRVPSLPDGDDEHEHDDEHDEHDEHGRADGEDGPAGYAADHDGPDPDRDDEPLEEDRDERPIENRAGSLFEADTRAEPEAE